MKKKVFLLIVFRCMEISVFSDAFLMRPKTFILFTSVPVSMVSFISLFRRIKFFQAKNCKNNGDKRLASSVWWQPFWPLCPSLLEVLRHSDVDGI